MQIRLYSIDLLVFIIAIHLLKGRVFSMPHPCSCPRQVRNSTHRNEVVSQRSSMDINNNVCHKVDSNPVVYTYTKRNAHLRQILFCFPFEARNIKVMTTGEIMSLQSYGNSATLCPCENNFDTFNIMSKDDVTNHTSLRILVYAKTLKTDIGVLEYDLRNETHFVKLKTGHEQVITSEKIYHQRHTRDTSSFVQNMSLQMTDAEICGKTKGCFRYDADAGCGHLSCDYFLSYSSDVRKGEVDIELSGYTEGWIGIGFSSDKEMGGEDDIIVCVKKHSKSLEIDIQAYVSVSRHIRPDLKYPHFANLTHAQVRDGYMYCRFTVPFSRPHVDSRRYLDLTNDWFQMYARGPLRNDGTVEKHRETPLVSNSLVSLIKPINIHTSSTEKCRYHETWLLIILLVGQLPV